MSTVGPKLSENQLSSEICYSAFYMDKLLRICKAEIELKSPRDFFLNPREV